MTSSSSAGSDLWSASKEAITRRTSSILAVATAAVALAGCMHLPASDSYQEQTPRHTFAEDEQERAFLEHLGPQKSAYSFDLIDDPSDGETALRMTN